MKTVIKNRAQFPYLRLREFEVQSSKFDVRCSMFDVRCSMFDVRCSMFDVSSSALDEDSYDPSPVASPVQSCPVVPSPPTPSRLGRGKGKKWQRFWRFLTTFPTTHHYSLITNLPTASKFRLIPPLSGEQQKPKGRESNSSAA